MTNPKPAGLHSVTSKPSDQSSTAALNRVYAFVLLDGKDFILNTNDYVFSPVNSIKNYLLNRLATDVSGNPIGNGHGDKFRQFQAFDVWMKSPERRSYSEIVFDPSERQKSHQFNLYRGTGFDMRKGKCGFILEHIHRIWCCGNNEAYDYVINWMARMIQRPDKHGETIITLHSEEGGGKGIITDILSEYFKHHHLTATHTRDITGRFNDKLATSIFVSINEAVWGGNKENEGILKTLATDRTITIEKKFIQKFEVRNCTHTIISSNNDWYAPLDKSDRRYFMLTLDNSICGDHDYFDRLASEIESGGKNAFIQFLYDRDICQFKPKIMPKVNSEERARIKNIGLNSIGSWVVDLIHCEELTTLDPDDQSDRIDSSQWRAMPIEIPSRLLYKDYIAFCRSQNMHPETSTAVGRFFSTRFGVKRRRSSGERRPIVYILPKISDCQQVMTDHLGGDSPF